MALEYIAMFAAEPNFTVRYPSDATSAWAATMLAAEFEGPTHIRLARPNNPIYGPEEEFAIGKATVVRPGSNDRLPVVAAGTTLFEALEGYEELKNNGIQIRGIDLFSIQPIDRETLIASARAVGKQVITVEDHDSRGGLGDASASAGGVGSLQRSGRNSYGRACAPGLLADGTLIPREPRFGDTVKHGLRWP